MDTFDPKQPGTVYVIGSPESTLVKIGYSTDVPGRIVAIQTMSPLPLVLLWQTPGTYQLESALHEHFRGRRKRGEWFDFNGEDPLPLIKAASELQAEAIRVRRLLEEREADQRRERMHRTRSERLAARSSVQPATVEQVPPGPVEPKSSSKAVANEPTPDDPIRIAGHRIEQDARERGVYMTHAEAMAAGAESIGDMQKAAYWRRIKAIVDEAPPLGPGQIAKLRMLLQPTVATASERSPRSGRSPAGNTKSTTVAHAERGQVHVEKPGAEGREDG